MSDRPETELSIVREIIACASYCNDMHMHNDPPLWDGPPEMSVSDRERKIQFENADHILKSLANGGFKIVKAS